MAAAEASPLRAAAEQLVATSSAEWTRLAATHDTPADVQQCDSADDAHVRRLIACIFERLGGVWHAAGVLADRVLSAQTAGAGRQEVLAKSEFQSIKYLEHVEKRTRLKLVQPAQERKGIDVARTKLYKDFAGGIRRDIAGYSGYIDTQSETKTMKKLLGGKFGDLVAPLPLEQNGEAEVPAPKSAVAPRDPKAALLSEISGAFEAIQLDLEKAVLLEELKIQCGRASDDLRFLRVSPQNTIRDCQLWKAAMDEKRRIKTMREKAAKKDVLFMDP